jgi:hypothetical protein
MDPDTQASVRCSAASLDLGVRLRDIAAKVGVTERSAFGIGADLAEAHYVVNAGVQPR